MLAMAFSDTALLVFRCVLSISIFFRSFLTIKECILSNASSVSIEVIVLFNFHFVAIMYHVYLFVYVEQSLYA